MKVSDNETISAQVILRSATGYEPGPTSEVTTRTLGRYKPSADKSAKAARAFKELGFDVGPAVGIGFSITGPSGLFRDVFNVELRREADSSLVAKGTDGIPEPELPRAALPGDLRRLLTNIVFEPPLRLM